MCEIQTLGEEKLADALAEVARLKNLIDNPQTEDWIMSVRLEAAHQQERWATNNDEGKTPQDWFWLLGHLAGKALAAFVQGNSEKGTHHIISSAAVLLNWHHNASGQFDRMRPGVADPNGGNK